MIKSFRKLPATLVIFLNIYFLWCTFVIIKDEGGAMGIGLMVLPITLSINLLLLPAIIEIRYGRKNTWLTIINSLGLIWSVFWLIFFLKPK